MQKWFFYVCVILILNSIFHILTPNSSVKGAMGFVFNLFLIGLILTPVLKNASASNLNSFFNSNLESLNDEQQIKQKIFETNEKTLKHALKLLLKNNGFENCKLVLKTNGNKHQTKIIIEVPSEKNYDANKIKNLIKNETGLTPEIIFK